AAVRSYVSVGEHAGIFSKTFLPRSVALFGDDRPRRDIKECAMGRLMAESARPLRVCNCAVRDQRVAFPKGVGRETEEIRGRDHNEIETEAIRESAAKASGGALCASGLGEAQGIARHHRI